MLNTLISLIFTDQGLISQRSWRLLSQIIVIFFLSPWAQSLWISLKVSVSALAEPLAQILRLVGSGLKFCKKRLKYVHHKSVSTSKLEMSENKVQMYKTFSLQNSI